MMERLKNYFEDISNVLFFKNAYFGFAFLILNLAFDPHLALAGVLASLVGHYFAQRGRTPKMLRDAGLLTINGFFFGLAMASLFPASLQFYLLLILGSLAVPLVTLAANEILQHWKLSPFIIPYILVTWVLYLSAHAVALQTAPTHWAESSPLVMQLLASPFVAIRLTTSILMGMGYIFFLPSPVFGLMILILITAFSPRRGFYFLAGTVLAALAAYALTSQQSVVADFEKYIYGAGLIGIGLASWPDRFNYKTILLFCSLSVFVTLASIQLFRHFDLPVLSLPYVLTMWLALLSRTPRYNLSWAE